MDDNTDTKNPFENLDSEEIANSQNLDDINLEEENTESDDNTDDNNEQDTKQEAEAESEEIVTQQPDTLQQEYDELNNRYIRLSADFDNFRKRTQTEKEELSQYTTANVLSKLTGVLDTFDRAQEHLKDIEDCKTVKDGYEVAYKQLIEALKKIGLEEIDALSKPFNPNEHEAVTKIPTDEFEPDSVAVVVQKGYKLNKRIIRPALVGVAIKKEDQ